MLLNAGLEGVTTVQSQGCGPPSCEMISLGRDTVCGQSVEILWPIKYFYTFNPTWREIKCFALLTEVKLLVLSIVHCLPLRQRATFWRVSNHNRFVLCMMMIWYCNQGIGHWAESIHCVCVMMIIASVFRTDCQILAPPPHWPPSGLGQYGPEDRVVTEITMGYLLGRIQIMVDTLSMVQKLQEVFLLPTTLLITFRRHTLYYKKAKC